MNVSKKLIVAASVALIVVFGFATTAAAFGGALWGARRTESSAASPYSYSAVDRPMPGGRASQWTDTSDQRAYACPMWGSEYAEACPFRASGYRPTRGQFRR